uniref:Cyclin-dependent kinase 2-associated protein 1-like n=1 Tax=Salmo trutta TaxID=8032 RepID=A0A674E9Q0_SALTR
MSLGMSYKPNLHQHVLGTSVNQVAVVHSTSTSISTLQSYRPVVNDYGPPSFSFSQVKTEIVKHVLDDSNASSNVIDYTTHFKCCQMFFCSTKHEFPYRIFLVPFTVSGQFIIYTHLVLGWTSLWLQNSLNSSGHGIVAQLVSRDLTCARKTFPTPLRHQPVPLTPGRMGTWTHAAYAKS